MSTHEDFTPRAREGYRQFRDEIEQLNASTEQISLWTRFEAGLSQPDNNAVVFDAQSWAAPARAYARSLRIVMEAVQETTADLEQRTAQQAGVNPGELAERVAGQVEEVAMLLGQLSQGSGA